MRTSFLFAQRIALLTALLFGGMLTLMAQTPGIPYQAYFVDNNAGYVPGEQIKDIPLANTEILLEFEVRNDKGEVEYIERIPVKTDEFGLASTIIGIGNGTPVLGSFSDIDWNGKPKTLYTDIDFSNTGNQFEDHGNMPIIYIPGPGGSGAETTTQLVYNNDGSYTYHNEDGDQVSFSVPQHGAGDPNTLGVVGNMGDLFVDDSTGNVYYHGGTNWEPLNMESNISTGPGGPTPTEPANPEGGDIYVDESTGDIYTYNNITNMWENQSAHISADAGNVLTEGTDGLAYFSGIATGAGAPTATNPANPNPGDIYVDESTGDIYTFDGTDWVLQDGTSITTGPGGPTPTEPANPEGGDIYVDESTGDIYTYNNITNMWENQSAHISADAGNVLTEGTDGLAYFSGIATGAGAPTATNPANPNPGDIYVDESTGDIYTFDGTDWVLQDGTSITTGPGGPTPTEPANPEGGDIYVDESTGDIYTYNNVTNMWENQSETVANNGLAVNADNVVQLGGDLIQPTTIATDATNTLAVSGLEDADITTGDYDIMVVNTTTGVIEKTPTSALKLKRYVVEYTAADGDINFATPQTILDLSNIDVYRNGARIDFTLVNTNTVKLDLGALTGCFAGDEIRIVQLQ